MKYEGDLKKGKRHGQGTLVYNDGAVYIGEWKNNKKHGHGTHTYGNGDEYTGEWKNGVRHGLGTFFAPDIGTTNKKTGAWKNDKHVESELNWKKLEWDIEYYGDEGKEDNSNYRIRVLPQLTLKNLKNRFNKSKFLRGLTNKNQLITESLIKAINADEELESCIFEDLNDADLYPKNYSKNMMNLYYTGKIFNRLSKDLSFKFLACFGDYHFSDAFGILHSKSSGLSYFISYLTNHQYGVHESWNVHFYGKKKSVIKRALKDITSRNYVLDVPLVFNKEFDWDLKKIIKSYSIHYDDCKQTAIERADNMKEKIVPFTWSMILCSHKEIEASRRDWQQKSIKKKPYHIFK